MNTHAPFSFSYRLIGSQALNAFGDHCAKIVVSALIAALFPERQAAVWVGLVSFLYIAPYILFAPFAGRMTRRFSKVAVVRGSLLLQMGAMGGLAASAWLGSFAGVLVSLAVVAGQSCFLAPARNALLKDLCGSAKLGMMMGLLGLAGVGATLAGLALGGWSFDILWAFWDSPWVAASQVAGVSAAMAFLAYVVVSQIRSDDDGEMASSESFVSVFRELASRPTLRWSSLGLAWFYGVGAMLVMILLQDGRWDHGQEVGAASQGGLMAALLGLGVAVGSGAAAFLNRKRIEVGLSFAGVAGIAAFAPLAAICWDSDLLSSAGVVLLGFSGGLFVTPLNALLLATARDEVRASTIAANNLVINLVTGFFIAITAGMGYVGVSPAAQLWVVAGTSFVVVGLMTYLVPESLVRLALLTFVRVFYPTKLRGLRNIPEKGGALLVANHVSYADAALIYAASPRPVRFIGTAEFLRYPLLRWAYRRFNVIAVSPEKAKEAVSKTVTALQEGAVVCVFPEGALTRTGMIMTFQKGAELMARLAKVPVVPACIDGMWGSILSFADKPFRYRWGKPLRRSLRIAFGPALGVGKASTSAMKDAVMKLGYECFSDREELKASLGETVWRELAKRPLARRLTDRGVGLAGLRNVSLMAASLSFAKLMRQEKTPRRIGILLPPGLAGFASNIGALWAGVSPVNLNPTAGEDSFASMLRQADLDTVLTSRRIAEKFPELPMRGVKAIFVEDMQASLKRIDSLLASLATLVLPASWVAKLVGISSRGGDREATLLFSSGSSAEPKGIPLSHRNLLANATQLSECYLMRSTDTVLSNLPLFHSFGVTGGLWLPLLKGMKIVATPSPLLVKENVTAVREEGVSVMLGTPTFLRGYLRKASAEDFASVRITVAGAEKLPTSLAEDWERRFGSKILEGYGLTECAPVVSANCLHSRAVRGRFADRQSGYVEGSVGRPVPGIWVRIVDEADTAKVLETGRSGLILVKGPNVFRGYLDVSENASRFVGDGWLNTGDVGRLEDDGCLRIEGRLSRFSKVGGEMVSHHQVEDAVRRAYPEFEVAESEELFVGSRPCPKKGEQLVLLARRALDCVELTRRLRALGMPNLWIPQTVSQVSRLPRLGTGKLDLKGCLAICAAREDRQMADA